LDCGKEVEEMRLRYEQRRDMFITALNAIPCVSCRMPQGAFYAWVRFDVPGMDSEAVCAYILEKAKVVGVPGVAYGTDECCVRFSFAASDTDLAEAARRIRIAMEELVK
jgi:aspartate aminotransferase